MSELHTFAVDDYPLSGPALFRELVMGIRLDYGYTLTAVRDGVIHDARFTNQNANPCGVIEVEYRRPEPFAMVFDPADEQCPVELQDAPRAALVAVVWSTLAKYHRSRGGKPESSVRVVEI